MIEAIAVALGLVLVVAWIAAEIRCGACTRIGVGLALAAVLVAGWFLADWRATRLAVMREERLRWIRFYADVGDIQKVERLASVSRGSEEESLGVHIWEEEDQIASQIRRLGGSATPCDKLDPLACVHVDFRERELTETILQRLGELPRIGTLLLDGTATTDNSLQHIGKLTRLQRLSLDNTKITDLGLQRLRGLSHLEWLSLAGTRVTDEGVKPLRDALPNCEIER